MKENPRYRTDARDDGIPPLFMFSPAFRDGFYQILCYAFRKYLRTKMSATRLYRPVEETLAAGDANAIAQHDKEIRTMVRAALSRAQTSLNYPPLDGPQAKKTAKTNTASLEDQEAERMDAVAALEKARLHGAAKDYFLPQIIDYDMLTLLFDLNHAVLTSGLVELGFATTQDEDESYVTRQIERLNNSHDLVHFDLAVLGAFLYGKEAARITFKQIHDTCIGAARSREVMLRVRPLLMAELCRRPYQLARMLIAEAADPGVPDTVFTERLDLFTRWVRCLNVRRFEPEILGSVSEFESSEVLTPLMNWVRLDDRDEDKLDDMLVQVSALRTRSIAG